MNHTSTQGYFRNLLNVFILCLITTAGMAQSQLGIYQFNGSAVCPNPNNNVSGAVSNLIFSQYTNVNASCVASDTAFNNKVWPAAGTGYNTFSITAASGYAVTLSSLTFTEATNASATGWNLKSSIDGFASIIASGAVTSTVQTQTIIFSSAVFSNLNTVTFRIYLIGPSGNIMQWRNDDVTIYGYVNQLPANPNNPTSNSPQCSNPGVTLTSNGSAPSGQTWYWQTNAAGTSTTNSSNQYNVTSSGTYYLRAQDNTTQAWSTGAGSLAVIVTPNVSSPIFTIGATSSRCQGAGSVTYSASANNSTGIVYSLDASCSAAGNTIDLNTGIVTYSAGWSGDAIITATASGCNGPVSSMHTATTNLPVGTPVFALGASSTRCQGSGTVGYTASSSNATGMTYSLDATSVSNGNSINSSTGVVTYASAWSGTSTITATAIGCYPLSATHNVTITPTVGTPVFTAGVSSTRCQGALTVSYAATSTNNTGITYTLDATSTGAGNAINPATGDVSYTSSWTGTSVITATSTGCGSRSSTHSAYSSAPVTAPVFSASNLPTRCQAAQNVTYTAIATNATSLSYALDGATLAAGNTINSATGIVAYTAGWYGTSIVTCTANGCYGPLSTDYTVTTTAVVGTPVFGAGYLITKCQGAEVRNYSATATSTSGITYSLNAPSLIGGNTINSTTGDVTYASTYYGTTIITASAAGCSGPKTAQFTVTVSATVGVPVFSSGAISNRCQGAGIVNYLATATANTGITYSLDAASISAGNSINSSTGDVTYLASWTGNSIITASATGCSGPTVSSHTATTTGPITAPVFILGTTSVRCQGANTVTYSASANNSTGITYSLDNASSVSNSINSSTGAVTYSSSWSGTSVITASAAGCSGPQTAIHTVTITPTVGNPSFTLTANSTRCQAAGVVTYAATATNNSGLTYSLDAASTSAGNSINSGTGDVSYTAGWTGTSVITVTATGCNGPKSAVHNAVTSGPVTAPVFTAGPVHTICQNSPNITYTATASNTSGITYTLDNASITGGNTISGSGNVNYASTWSGTTTITANAAGCYGPLSASFVVTVTPTVGTPVFASGSTSSICQAPGVVSYPATATSTSGITYSLNGPSLTAGNTINSSTGDVTYAATYVGTTTITASAAGCSGPKTAQHTEVVRATVGTPVFTLGATSTHCQGITNLTYSATATTNTGIVYTMDGTSISAGNSINSSTGAVTFLSSWSGSSIIIATASGCNGPSTASHIVTITPTVGVPAFALGAGSSRCQGIGSVTFTANSSNNTGLSYSLDANSITNGNSISNSTGMVTYAATWSGLSTITATATGCNGPVSATHIDTTKATVGAPVFTVSNLHSRCKAAGVVNYAATAFTSTGISYSLDGTSTAAGNSINSGTGDVTYTASWTGISTITATATGCSGPKSTAYIVTTNDAVTIPVFALGNSSTTCQAIGSVPYSATANNTSGITYSLDPPSLAGGNTINALTGDVTYSPGWTGTSTITASAAGCYGPLSATHTVTITPTVTTPVFASGSTSTRCQGFSTIMYTSSASNTSGITYTLDATSSAGGNTINVNTGSVTYSANWSGTSVITSSAAGCNGPKTAQHTVTTTATVGVPAFIMGGHSTRSQAAGSVVYNASATTNTGITYSMDAASQAAGNTLNVSTGTVTYAATWVGTTTITATASGCSGPTVATHLATTNANIVSTPLYLSNPSQGLDRIDPVASAFTTTMSTVGFHSGDSSTFTMGQVLWLPLIIQPNTITITNYVIVSGGSLTATPNISATLQYGQNNIITISNPTYNSASGLLTWTGSLPASVTVPAGSAISLVVKNFDAATIKINYASQTKPSKIVLPVSTFVKIVALDAYNAAYPGGSIRSSTLPNTNNYIRATVTDPFGASDISGVNMNITPAAYNGPATRVSTSGSTSIYEYNWLSPSSRNYIVTATAKQGLENAVTFTKDLNLNICTLCPPVAVSDSSSGAGGAPVVIDVLANDYDPNNNINTASLNILTPPLNGSAIVSNGKIVYLPNGTFNGVDQFTYGICDSTSLCDSAVVKIKIDPTIIDACSDATKSHVFYVPYPEQDARVALLNSQNTGLPIDSIRTIISIKCPYPGMTIVWDHWEDGYEVNPLNPTQASTQIWGDGNPYNGIAPGYPDDIIPAGGSIVLDNTMYANPRSQASFYYDGRDKVYSSGQISMTEVCGEPSRITLQCMKSDIAASNDYGKSFTIPCGQDFPSQDFAYTALFIRAAQDSTVINIDKDNNGTFETNIVLNQGQSYLVDGGVLTGATVTSSAPIGVDLHFGGIDNYSSREIPLYPASWYSNTYYSPVPTTGSATAVKDTSVVMLYNSLSRPITINYSSGIPSNGSIVLPAKTAKRFPLALSQTAAYKFVNPTGESFTAIQICDSYSPGGGGNSGSTFDWAFNLIAEDRLTSFATTAWAPGSFDLSRNDNPIWVTTSANTTIYVKYDGDLTAGGSVNSCGLHYDVSYLVNALNHKRIKNLTTNNQSGLAVYTCDGTKVAAVYGEDPSTAQTGFPSWDVGTTLRPFCALKLILANDDYAFTLTDNPVTIPILKNDYGFTAVIDPTSVSMSGLLQPKHGAVTLNANGTVLYTPNLGYIGLDTFQYRVCSTPSPIVCDDAMVYVTIANCPAPAHSNIIAGQVFLDTARDGINHGKIGFSPAKVYLYVDGNCNGLIDTNELSDSVSVDPSGTYQFITYPEKTISDNFEGPNGTSSCGSGSDGNSPWASNWVDAGDPSVGFCVTPAATINNTKAEIVQDGAFGHALRLKGPSVSATRTVNLNGATYAFLTFSYRRGTANFIAGEDITVQASTNGSTFYNIYTIAGTGIVDPNYLTVFNQDISAYASSPTTYIRFLTNSAVRTNDSVFIDNVSVKYLKYPQCYITQLSQQSIPSNYTITTTTQRTISLSGNNTCIYPFDFGVNKKVISVSGLVWDDSNGNLIKDGVENVVDGTNSGASVSAGLPLYVNLIDSLGLVMDVAQVRTDGTYTFPYVLQSYPGLTLQLSANPGTQNASMPAVTLPNNWVTIGENKNGQGGVADNLADSKILFNTTTSNITLQNFAIERLPSSDPKTQNYGLNVPNTWYTIPALTGSDPEDGIAGAGKKYKIINLPTGATLAYNGVNVVAGQVISNYNSALLKISPAINTYTANFDYALIDAAGKMDPVHATVTVFWGAVLPIESMPLTGVSKDKSNLLNWSTESEIDTDHFELQNSADGSNYITIANVSSRGNSNSKTLYHYLHQYPMGTLNFYRVKLVKRTGQASYSNTVLLKAGAGESELVIMPNPFSNTFSVAVKFMKPGKATLTITDAHGKTIKVLEFNVMVGVNTLKIDNLDKLTSGAYFLSIKKDDEVFYGKVFKIK